MNSKIIALFTLAIFTILIVQAQEDRKIQFEETTHQFGQLKKGDPAEHTFVFTNVSEDPVQLSRVKASCGCTTPSWTRESIEPGQSGEIKVKYNSARVGPFTKTVTVTYDSVERPVVLYIKGNVESPPADEAQIYREKVGNLAFDRLSQSVSTLDSDKKKVLMFKVKNVGTDEIRFLGKYDKEMMIDVNPASMVLLPGNKTEIEVMVHGDKFLSYGNFEKAIAIYTNDEEEPHKTLKVNGIIHKIYTAEELAMMPNIEFEANTKELGTIIEGEKIDVTYAFTNTGKNDLIIESVKASCGCTATTPKDKLIKPGASSEIVATFNSAGRQGAQNKSITVRTNDPDNPTTVLRFKVEVEKDPFHMNSLGPAANSQKK